MITLSYSYLTVVRDLYKFTIQVLTSDGVFLPLFLNLPLLSSSFEYMGIFCDLNLVLMRGEGGLNLLIIDRLIANCSLQGHNIFQKGCDSKILFLGLVITKVKVNNLIKINNLILSVCSAYYYYTVSHINTCRK